MFITTLTSLSELLSSSAYVCMLKKPPTNERHFYVQGIILIHAPANHLGLLHKTFKSLHFTGTHALVFLCHIK